MTTLKTHVALRVSDVRQSVAFYQAMFGIAPVKHKLDYAKFDLESPALNLTLNQSNTIEPHGALSHLGIQVGSTEEVHGAIARFRAADLTTFEEHDTNCCYALQDKVWVTDPDGNHWEIFVVKMADTTPDQNIGTGDAAKQVQSTCCA
ncbi:MAG: ArsI/CadI family heavy metal resistance metalloenzyme [Elainellaceae cyanobacterium]